MATEKKSSNFCLRQCLHFVPVTTSRLATAVGRRSGGRTGRLPGPKNGDLDPTNLSHSKQHHISHEVMKCAGGAGGPKTGRIGDSLAVGAHCLPLNLTVRFPSLGITGIALGPNLPGGHQIEVGLGLRGRERERREAKTRRIPHLFCWRSACLPACLP